MATKKPFTSPITAPATITISITAMIHPPVVDGRCSNISLVAALFCRKAADIPAAKPNTRPAERSVPVRTIQPPIPSAIGSETAASISIFAIELGLRKFLFLMAVYIMNMTISI